MHLSPPEPVSCFLGFLEIFIYLVALGLSCHMWDLSLWRMESPVAALWLSCSTACEIFVPRPGVVPPSFALQGGFLTTGPPASAYPLFM